MFPHVFLAATLTFTLTLACSTPMSNNQFADLFCNSEMVISGSITAATSSLARNGPYTLTFSKHYVNVGTIYKGVPQGTATVTVYRNWNEETDDCDSAAFPDGSDSYVFFANATGTWYKLDACAHSFPVSCVPLATFDTIC